MGLQLKRGLRLFPIAIRYATSLIAHEKYLKKSCKIFCKLSKKKHNYTRRFTAKKLTSRFPKCYKILTFFCSLNRPLLSSKVSKVLQMYSDHIAKPHTQQSRLVQCKIQPMCPEQFVYHSSQAAEPLIGQGQGACGATVGLAQKK